MANAFKKLTREERAKAEQWLTERQAVLPCPSCGTTSWAVGDSLVLVPMYQTGGPIIIGAGFPAVLMVCNRCGFFRMHSAILIGLVPPDPETEGAKHGA
jgi:hypothetical protein